MLKPTEISKKVKSFEKKWQKFQVFGKKIAKISSIWKKKLQIFHNFGQCIVASDLVLSRLLGIDFKIEFRLYFDWHHVETMIQNFE